MQKRVRKEKGVFVQIQGFMDRNSGLLTVANGSVARHTLDDAVTGLTAAEAEQNQHRQISQASRVQMLLTRKRLLTKQLRSVAAAAHLTADQTPELTLVVAPSVNSGTTDLIAAAKKMVQDTEPYSAVLAPVVGPDYANAIRASITAVEQAQVTGRASRAQGAGATSETKRWARRARLAVRVLHPLVTDALEQEPKLLVEWNACRKNAGVAHVSAPTAATTQTATPTQASAPVAAAGSREVTSAA